MERRRALKVLAGASFMATVAGAYDEKLIVNKNNYEFQNPKNPTDYELKHTPDISISDTDENGFALVEITVGQNNIVHPSIDNHWIYKIELFADGKRVGITNLEPTISRGYLASRVQLKGVETLSATACCNLHGNYSASISI